MTHNFLFIYINIAEIHINIGESSSTDEDANNESKTKQITEEEQPEYILRDKNVVIILIQKFHPQADYLWKYCYYHNFCKVIVDLFDAVMKMNGYYIKIVMVTIFYKIRLEKELLNQPNQ